MLGEVQRQWSHLESIFIASEDIRKNLPQDAARFDKIDKDFKVLAYHTYFMTKMQLCISTIQIIDLFNRTL